VVSAEAAASLKRNRLEAIMGGFGGSTSFGFGGSVGSGGVSAPAPGSTKQPEAASIGKGGPVQGVAPEAEDAQCILSTSQGPAELQKDDAASMDDLSASKKLKATAVSEAN
jgi:hypothetical protein